MVFCSKFKHGRAGRAKGGKFLAGEDVVGCPESCGYKQGVNTSSCVVQRIVLDLYVNRRHTDRDSILQRARICRTTAGYLGWLTADYRPQDLLCHHLPMVYIRLSSSHKI